MTTKQATSGPGSIGASYTDREHTVVSALTGLRFAAPDPDAKARARDALMLILTAERTADEQRAPQASLAS